MKRSWALLAGLALSISAYAQPDSSDEGTLDAVLRQAVEHTPIPGLVAMAVTADGIVYEGAFGLKDVAGEAPMTLDSMFRIASMTKPVTSVAVMMLVEQGDIGLDDPIGLYLPELADMDVIDEFDLETGEHTTRPAAGPITIRHLLTHSSGLGYGFSSTTLLRMTDGSFDVSATDLPLLHDPGARWTYGESTRVLGRLVERISGQPLEAFMQARIFAPLNMSDTGYSVPPEKMARVVTVHGLVDGKLSETPNPDRIAPDDILGDGGLVSTAADYAKFMQMLLRGGRAPDGRALLSEATVQSMGENHLGEVRVSLQDAALPNVAKQFPLGAGRDGFGLGFQITGEHAEPDTRAPGSMSWAGIYNTEFWVDPATGIGAVLLMQYLPFYDGDAIATLIDFEQRLYRSLD
jgi:CubicO group peptidase (beta-lactamase class C family)